MRTMFISLVLIWSLAQLASAGGAIDSGGCGTVYKCYAPEKCIYSTTPPSKTFVQSAIVEIMESHQLFDDCEAIIRFHRFTQRKMYISMESFQDTVKKIEFIQNDNAQQLLNLFSCEVVETAGKILGKSGNVERFSKDITLGKMKCVFEDKPVLHQDNDKKEIIVVSDVITIAIYVPDLQSNLKKSTTKVKKYTDDIKERCNPANFDYEPPKNDQTKIYKKISTKYLPEKYECDDKSLYKMEYKKKGSDSFSIAKKIFCVPKTPHFGVYDVVEALDESGDEIYTEYFADETFEIRCVAETKFFCKYQVKLKDGEQFPRLKENADGSSEIKCPDEKPYLAIAGEVERYIHKPEFKCLRLGHLEPAWILEMDGVQEQFTQVGPEVYCTNHLKCYQSISESAVEEGFLDQNFLPKCFSSGVLKTVDKKEVTTRCDHSDGKFKYKAGGEEKAIDDNTKFVCEYPPDEHEAKIQQQDKKNEDKIMWMVIAGTVVAIVVGAGVIGGVTFSLWRKAKKDKRIVAAQQKNVNKYYTAGERKAALAAKLNKENPTQEKSKPDEKPEEEKWSPVVMSARYMAMTKFTYDMVYPIEVRNEKDSISGETKDKMVSQKLLLKVARENEPLYEKVAAKKAAIAAAKKLLKIRTDPNSDANVE